MKNKSTFFVHKNLFCDTDVKGRHRKRMREKGKCFQYMDLETVSKCGMDKSISQSWTKKMLTATEHKKDDLDGDI